MIDCSRLDSGSQDPRETRADLAVAAILVDFLATREQNRDIERRQLFMHFCAAEAQNVDGAMIRVIFQVLGELLDERRQWRHRSDSSRFDAAISSPKMRMAAAAAAAPIRALCFLNKESEPNEKPR